MLFGTIARPSKFNATLSGDGPERPKNSTEGYIFQEKEFIAVGSPNPQTAARIAKELSTNAQWQAPDQPGSAELYDYLKKTASQLKADRDQLDQSQMDLLRPTKLSANIHSRIHRARAIGTACRCC
jgi:hypothetical protein